MSEGHVAVKRMFESAHMGALKVKNRLVMAPMGTRLASEIGGVTQRQIDYYAERAKGGVGTIITEVNCVDHPLGITGPTNMTIHDNSYLGAHNELVEAVRAYGAKIICQLVHAGRQTKPASIKGMQPVAPSPIPCKFLNVMPRELSTSEVEAIIRKFIEAAVRVKTAGYDGVELHGGHGYLIAQFMSPASNQRKDRYGGGLHQRMAFPLEIIQGIREELGRHFPLLFRFSAEEFVEGGRELEESKEVARILEEAGVDVLDVSAGSYDSIKTMIEPMSYGQAWKIYLAESIKEVVNIPVIGVGVIRTPDVAEGVLKDGKVDFVAMGRALLADPYWPQKAREGRDKEIIPCISCNVGCLGESIFRDLHIRCSVNPLTGRERLREKLVSAIEKKKVFVLGGGAAGMMAALTAKQRGHQVTLFEKDGQLGGQLRLAARPPEKGKIEWFRDYLLNQMEQQKIEVRLGNTATSETIIQGRPDVVIVATGAVPFVPEISGIETQSICTAWEVLEGKEEVKDKVVVVAGGGTVGCETALYLATGKNKVIIAEMLDDLALDMDPINRMELLEKIKDSNIQVLLGRKLKRIEQGSVILSRQETENEQVKTDLVVLALGSSSKDDLSPELEGKIKEVYTVGDSCEPRKIIDAVYEGFLSAIRI
ncbi:FAD-dependent oxidoreductase [Thermodesulfobacteriota bacterium]